MPAERLVASYVCMNSVRAAGLGQRVLGANRWPDCGACLRQSTGKKPLKHTKSRRRSRGDGLNFATATAVANNQRSAGAQPSRTRWQDERTCPIRSAQQARFRPKVFAGSQRSRARQGSKARMVCHPTGLLWTALTTNCLAMPAHL
jgi:hypothetical protein